MCIIYSGTLDNIFSSILVVQIGTMKCFYCPQKDVSLVPWDSLSPTNQTFLRDKYPDAVQRAVCDWCVAVEPCLDSYYYMVYHALFSTLFS